MKGHTKVGSVEGTAAAINVELGFTPVYVKCYNYDAASSAASVEWFAGMAAGHGLKNTTDTQAKITANGISAYAGTASGDGVGFTIGTDAALNVDGETIFYVAFGPDE